MMGMLEPILLVIFGALVLSFLLARRISRQIMAPLSCLDLENLPKDSIYEELEPMLLRINLQRRQIAGQLRELQRKNDEFAQITHSMTEGLVLLNEKGVIFNLNPTAMKLFQTTLSCEGMPFSMIEQDPKVTSAIEKAMTDGFGEVRIERDGREYQLDVNRIESDHHVIGAVILTFDITEQAFAERNRREFTANVSHELKSPLQSIMGSAELIENGLVKTEDITRFVGHIRNEAQRLVCPVNDIIRLSQLDEREELPFEEINLRDVANEVVASLSETAKEKNVSISVSGDSPTVHSVKRLFSEIIFNLCENSIKYNKDGGKVDVILQSDQKTTSLIVKDTGIGIPLEHQSRVFERFCRVDKSHSRESGGTGLGLSIVKHTVQFLHGKIDLQSRAGVGTTIKISFNNG